MISDGGFLQYGSNNYDDPSAMLSETDVKCIIVAPAYRLGIFGFLASRELWNTASETANFGFWDQRLALEWTYDNIQYFEGNKNNITVGGLSAGSYSTFHQLAHDIGPKCTHQIIRRVFQWSNGCGVQPKKIQEVQQQFENLLSVLKIPGSWNASRKLRALRRKTSLELIEAVGLMKQKFFRPILDGDFVSERLFENIFTGNFGQRMRDLGIQTVIGDLTQEFHLYKTVFPPSSYDGLVDRLSWDYPGHLATAICSPYKILSSSPKMSADEWREIFGKVYADMQIHSTMRGLVHEIGSTLPLSHIHRYRIDWRTASVDKKTPREFGATHGTDMSIWFFGNGDSLSHSEKQLIREWLRPIASFLNGDKVVWGTQSLNQVRYINSEGKIEIKDDDLWEEKLSLWGFTKEITQSLEKTKKSKL